MEYLKIDDTFFWKEIPILPGVYFIYSLNEKKAIKTRRVLGVDKEGVLYIGKSENLRDRLRMLWRVLNTNYKANAHTFGEKYNTYKILKDNFPKKTLAIKFVISKNPKVLESKMLNEYIKKYGEVPPFNSSK